MAELQKRTVKFTVDKKGAYVMTAGEGFSGESCTEKTKNLELALGGMEISGGKTQGYYDPDGDSPIKIEIPR